MRGAAQRLEPSGEARGCQKVCEVRSQLIVGFVVEVFYSRVLGQSAHSLKLTVDRRMVGLGQAVLHSAGLADHVGTNFPAINGVVVPGLLYELDTVIAKNGVDQLRHGFQQMLKELQGLLSFGCINVLSDGKFHRSVNAHREIELTFSLLRLGMSIWTKPIC